MIELHWSRNREDGVQCTSELLGKYIIINRSLLRLFIHSSEQPTSSPSSSSLHHSQQHHLKPSCSSSSSVPGSLVHSMPSSSSSVTGNKSCSSDGRSSDGILRPLNHNSSLPPPSFPSSSFLLISCFGFTIHDIATFSRCRSRKFCRWKQPPIITTRIPDWITNGSIRSTGSLT